MRHFDVRIFQIAKGNISLSGGNSEWEPPDPFPNSEVKTLSADGSVGSPHVRVGHRQALNSKSPDRKIRAFFVEEPVGDLPDHRGWQSRASQIRHLRSILNGRECRSCLSRENWALKPKPPTIRIGGFFVSETVGSETAESILF